MRQTGPAPHMDTTGSPSDSGAARQRDPRASGHPLLTVTHSHACSLFPSCIQQCWADGEHSLKPVFQESRSEPVTTWSAGH